jgi:hypothetical protein
MQHKSAHGRIPPFRGVFYPAGLLDRAAYEYRRSLAWCPVRRPDEQSIEVLKAVELRLKFCNRMVSVLKSAACPLLLSPVTTAL